MLLPLNKTNCKHTFLFSGYKGKFGKSPDPKIFYRCHSCGEERSLPMTRNDAKVIFSKNYSGIHAVWSDFLHHFIVKKTTWKFRWTGTDLISRVENWAKDNKNDVIISYCDDDVFMSSLLVFIEHKTKDHYMGTTVVFIPQSSFDTPFHFFLYPQHRKKLAEVLQQIEEASISVHKNERRCELKKENYFKRRGIGLLNI